MISDSTLELAVAHGDITADQAGKLRTLEAATNGALTDSPDDEKLRFITGFADIFVTIGIGLFLGAAAYFIHLSLGTLAGYIGTAGLSWLLAEFFTRKRRQALPSIVLLLTFIVASFEALSVAINGLNGGSWVMPFSLFSIDFSGPRMALAALLTAAFAVLHYWRFRVPITIAAGTAALCIMPIAIAATYLRTVGVFLLPVTTFICGILVFALAMRFDMSDPKRETRRTDIAFWLHLLAAPLIVHSLVSGFFNIGKLNQLDIQQSIVILSAFLFLALLAIVIDRRAILVSGLAYAGYAFSTLIRQSGFDTTALPATLLVLGLFVLLLSALWQPLRHLALRLIPSRFAQNLPHPITKTS